MSLKDELLGRTTSEPGFALVLPPGWEAHRPDEAAETELLSQASARLKSAHRPDLYGQLRANVRHAFTDLRARDGIALYLQTEAPEGLIMPMSITATRVRAVGAETLDGQVAALIREHGARPLGEDRSMIRWVKDAVQSIGTERAATRSIAYLTPVPGSGRRTAVQFTTVIVHPVTTSPEDPLVRSLEEVSDTVLSTFRWMPAS